MTQASWLTAGIAITATAIGTGAAIATVARKAMETAARQPEIRNDIQRMMILGMAFIEALCLYALLIALLLTNKSDQPAAGDHRSPEPEAVSGR